MPLVYDFSGFLIDFTNSTYGQSHTTCSGSVWLQKCLTRDIVLPVTLVGLHAPEQPRVTLASVRSVLGTLIIHTAVSGVGEVTLRLGTRELGHVSSTCPH